MRLALHHHDDLVVLGLATMIDRYARDIRLVDLGSRTTHHVDLVLIDPANAARTGGPKMVAKLFTDPCIRRIAVLTGSFDPDEADRYFARGYVGCLSTRLPSRELVHALRAIHDGRRVLAPRAEHPDRGGSPGREHGLTRREADVLALIAAGLSNHEIATQLHVSINSVKSYVRSAYDTIGVDSRTKAVLWTLTHGLQTPHGHLAPPRPRP